MCSYDYDPADIFEIIARRARVRHRCDECFVYILPGESYARASWLADGAWNDSVRCALCYFLAEAIETLLCNDGGQILWGGQCLREEIDYLGNEPEFQWPRELFATITGRIFEARP